MMLFRPVMGASRTQSGCSKVSQHIVRCGGFYLPQCSLSSSSKLGIVSGHSIDCECAACSPLFPSTTARTMTRSTTSRITSPLSSTRKTSPNEAMLSRRQSTQSFTTFDSLTNSMGDDGDEDEESNPVTDRLLENNRRWVEERKSLEPDYFDKLSQIQQPTYLYFGCSDSRIHANEILGLG